MLTTLDLVSISLILCSFDQQFVQDKQKDLFLRGPLTLLWKDP